MLFAFIMPDKQLYVFKNMLFHFISGTLDKILLTSFFFVVKFITAATYLGNF